jgi:ribonuclease D
MRGLELPEDKLPHFPQTRRAEVTERTKERIKNLKSWRQHFSSAHALDPGVLAPNWLLEEVAELSGAEITELDTITDMRQWQKQLFGSDLINVLAQN